MFQHVLFLVLVFTKETSGLAAITVRRIQKNEIEPFATFRAAVFTSGDRCDVSTKDTVCKLLQHRISAGSQLLVASTKEERECPPSPRKGQSGGFWFRPSLDVSEMLDQSLADGERIAGVVEASTTEFDLPTHSLDPDEGLYITALAVHPAYRRSGVATTILSAAEDEAALAGARSLMLHVSRDNLPAIEFYKSTGFDQLKDKPHYRQFATALNLNPHTHVLFRRQLSQ